MCQGAAAVAQDGVVFSLHPGMAVQAVEEEARAEAAGCQEEAQHPLQGISALVLWEALAQEEAIMGIVATVDQALAVAVETVAAEAIMEVAEVAAHANP